MNTACIVYFIQTKSPSILRREQPLSRKLRLTYLVPNPDKKKAYDQRHSNPYVFRIGGLVLKKDFKRKKRKGGKLDPKWAGPYTIVGNLGHGLYHLQEVTNPSNFISRVNGTHLKEYKQRGFAGSHLRVQKSKNSMSIGKLLSY